jgi:hypothetical protein
MGIYSLKTLINKYIEEVFVATKIQSEVCYIDFTYKICISTDRIMSMYNSNPTLYSNPIEIVIDIIKKDVDLLYNQIQMNKFFKKFVIAIDYGMKGKNSVSSFKFDENLIDIFFKNASKYVLMKSNVMIPRNMIEHLNDPEYFNSILSSIRLMADLRYNQRKTIDDISIEKYISLEYLKDKISPKIYKQLKYYGLTKYMLSRGCKSATRARRQNAEITLGDTTEENFNKEFRDKLMTISPNVIIALVPYMVKLLLEQINDEYTIEFIGTSTESDFSIIKHINMYHQRHCPTIYTNDTDFFTLLCDKDVIIKYPYQNERTREKYNVSIRPKDFWNWLVQDNSWNYQDIVTISCLLGTDYNRDSPYHIRTIEKLKKFYKENHSLSKKDPKGMYTKVYKDAVDTLQYSTRNLSFLLAMELYSQATAIETQVLYIEPDNLDIRVLNEMFRCMYVDATFNDA